ncbi:MAG TPA: lycopene cyclase domain-containing protein [Sphingobacteriaceae bacterium]
MNSLYLIVNIASFIVPFIFSFHPKLAFYKKWKFIWPAIILSAIPFVAWDVYFTRLGIWGFNPDYLSGSAIFNLPYEEVLFFICIPYACLFTYHCLGILIEKDLFSQSENWITTVLLIMLTLLAFIFSDRLYTMVTFAVLILLLAFIKVVLKPSWLSRFYFSYLILLVPFTIVNGVLTGTGIQEPIVWYNNKEIMGIRFLTIPVEDIFYGMLLILLNVLIYETLKRSFSKTRS